VVEFNLSTLETSSLWVLPKGDPQKPVERGKLFYHQISQVPKNGSITFGLLSARPKTRNYERFKVR